MGIPTSKRLRKPREFQAVRNEGKRILAGLLFFSAGNSTRSRGARVVWA